MLVPINKGTLPNWNPQTDSPELFNMFVDKEGKLNYTPGLALILALGTCRAIWNTPFDGGCYIIVTNDDIWRIKESGSQTHLATILDSSLTVEITENLQNQLTIVDGKKAYVIDQADGDTFTTLGGDQGFSLVNPGSCCTINGFTVVLDTNNGQWQVSNANDALVYDPANINVIDPSLFQGLAVRNSNNNLFIFGTAGIERWEPTLNVNIYLFPLQKDMNFKVNFGAVSTSCVVANINTIYFLSSRFMPMQLTAQGFKELVPFDEKEDQSGISREISNYPDVNNAIGSFYSFRGNLFYQLTFEESQKTWVYCVNSNTFANTDDFIIGSAFTTEFIILQNGFYQLSEIASNKHRYWIGDDINEYKGQQNYRMIINGCEARLTQGNNVNNDEEELLLSVSLDRKTWSNHVACPMGTIGKFNQRTLWRMNIAAQYFKPRIDYYGSYPLTIEAFDVTIN